MSSFPVFAVVGAAAFGAGCAFGNKMMDHEGHLDENKTHRTLDSGVQKAKPVVDTTADEARLAKEKLQDSLRDLENDWRDPTE